MGFGYLLLGYFFMADFVVEVSYMSLDIFPDFIGWILMTRALFLLSRNPKSCDFKKFNSAKWISIAMLIFSSVIFIRGTAFHGVSTEVFDNAARIFEIAGMLLYHYFLIFGIMDFAKNSKGNETLITKLNFSFYTTVFYYAIYTVLVALFFAGLSKSVIYSALFRANLLVGLFWFWFNTYVLYVSYKAFSE